MLGHIAFTHPDDPFYPQRLTRLVTGVRKSLGFLHPIGERRLVVPYFVVSLAWGETR